MAGAIAVGISPEADHHALPQSAGDGCRGAAARPPRRRRGADGRLRQDHAGAAVGCDQHEFARDLSSRRADAARNWKGRTLGSGSDAWKYWDERRAGKISDKDWVDVEAGIARSYGTCMTMGTG